MADDASDHVLAAIDVGTNSFHMVIARVGPTGGFDVLTREKDTVRLGHGGGDMKVLEPDAIARGLDCLARMKRIADSYGAPIRAVATSAVREAANAAEFLDAAGEIGVDIEVISGVEEARLIGLGVLQAVPVYERRMLLADIGGGSTEILVAERGETRVARSFKLGAVRLTDRYFADRRTTTNAVKQCRAHIRSLLTVLEREVADTGFDVAVASSGTAEAVAKMVQAQRGGTAPHTFNCFEFSTEELSDVTAVVLEARHAEGRRAIAAMDAGRADIIAAGVLILEGIAHTFGVSGFTFSDYALREGTLLDAVQRAGRSPRDALRDVASRSVRQLAARCDDDTVHSTHVAALATRLFDVTADVHRLGPAERDLLEAAALLANVGLVVSHSKHHLHSYYVIRNSELVGFTDHEIELIAQIARYHRKSAPKDAHATFAGLRPADQSVVRTLAGLLRVAIGLDRSHDQRVVDLDATVSSKKMTITVAARGADDVDLELYAANERSALLTDVFARTVVVRAGAPPSAPRTD